MLIGKQLGPFAIDKELGSGAMGAVFRAKYVKTGAFVAIKVMAPGVSSGEQNLARFEREAAILRQLKHPNIVRLLATGRYHGQPFYAMEYIQGESLDHVLERRGRLSWEEIVTMGQPLCSALQHAHEKGIVHRDLKPSNLMILSDGTIKLTDFGIAKDLDVTQLTSAHCTVGTAAYMSPEQCKGERNLTGKSDLYSLGIVFYELVTGRKPFLAETPMDMFLQHVQGKFPRPSLAVLDMPKWLDTLICQLLEKKPELRPQDAKMVGGVLATIQEEVETKKSAGVKEIEKRRADRDESDSTRPTDEDKEAARALRMGLGKVKPKKPKKKKPFFQRKWVRGVGIFLALVVISGGMYYGLQPASPATLYARAEKLMNSENPDDWEMARDGPITEYLKRYGKQDNGMTHKVQAWADKVDPIVRERQLRNRVYLARFKEHPNGDEEKFAFSALEHEEKDEYVEANYDWQKVKEGAEKSADSRILALVAENHLDFIQQAQEKSQEKEDEISKRVHEAKKKNAVFEPTDWDDKIERAAAEAIWNDDPKGSVPPSVSLDKWENIRKISKGQPLWQIMATRNIEQLKEKSSGSK